MFGKNKIRGIAQAGADLQVQSIFHTIQGEGPEAGRPAVFVRLAGCNLACTMCDTEFESGMGFPPMSVQSVLEQVLRAQSVVSIRTGATKPLVVLTGGEPLRQDTTTLIIALNGRGFDVQIETAGTTVGPAAANLDHLLKHNYATLVCSPKTSKIHQVIEKYCRHYKYVVDSRDASPVDGLPVKLYSADGPTSDRILFRPRPVIANSPKVTVWVSPCDTYDTIQNANNVRHAVAIATSYGYRLSLQVHKLIGVE